MSMLEKFWLIIKDELMIFLIAALPVSELRGAIPFGLAKGMSPLKTYVISVIGSVFPAPFLLLFLNSIFKHLKQIPLLKRIVYWSVKRSRKKTKQIKKYSFFGLFILVAIPLPSTGVWTGCIAASLLGLKLWRAFPPVFLGTMIAGLLVLALSLHVI